MSTITFDSITISEAESAAKKFSIESELILAIIWQESRGRSDAIRFETGYFNMPGTHVFNPDYFAKLAIISQETEVALQCFSFGPMQLMGATARRLGYSMNLVNLLSKELGIYWGSRFLSTLIFPNHPIEDAIATYNHGSPAKNADGKYIVQSYVDAVMQNYRELKNPTA